MTPSSSDTHLDPQWAGLAEIERLLGAREISPALQKVAEFRPRDRRQQVELERLSAQARYIVGDDKAALRHLVRALRLTSRLPEPRVHIRSNLADVLLRVGDTAAAERQLRRALTEVHSHGIARSQQPWLLNGLALIQRRRGMLTFAVQTYDQALSLAKSLDGGLRGWGAIANNLALVLIHLGDLERAGEILDNLRGESEHALPRSHQVGFHLTCALHGLQSGDFDSCEHALARAREQLSDSDLRARFVLRGYSAELEIARGQAEASLPALQELLQEAFAQATLGDMISGTARRLATALLETDRAKEALEKARLAVQHGRAGDVQEWAAGLRLTGECLAALDRSEEARAALAEALSVLQASECLGERQRLEVTMARLGLVQIPRGSEPAPQGPAFVTPEPAATREDRRAIRLALRDGRSFLTHDAELASRIRVASGDQLPILIAGETGTGKELVAHLVHELGPSAKQPFVVVDCATLPESLAEAELFGSARGAFSGAVADRAGLVAASDGGTLFLDELPELSPAIQAKLLRLLQDGTYRRVGEDRMRRVRARIVAATNRDPEVLVTKGLLKPDLFFRLNGHRLHLKPLRERPADIRLLASARAREERLAGITEGALARLLAYSWPGNVRELEMLLRVVASGAKRGAWLDESAFAHLGSGYPSSPAADQTSLRAQRAEAEREMLKKILERHQGNIASAARELSMTRQGLHKALRRTGLI